MFLENNLKKSKESLKKLLAISVLLTVISCNNDIDIPTINIIKDGEIKRLIKEPCDINYTHLNEFMAMPGKIRRRGGVSCMYPKRSYSLNLAGKYALANLSMDDDWILNANYVDKTFMRHKISFDLFREMNTKNIASKCAYINVNVNDEKRGLYVLMQKINGAMIGLNKEDSLSMLFKDPPVFYKEKLSFVQDSSNYYHQKFPKLDKHDKSDYIKQFINFMLYSSDDDFIANIDNWVDIENIIDWHLLLLFSNNSDGIKKNFYLYKLDSKTPFRVAIWDYDHSFGRDGGNGLNMATHELDCNRSELLKRLMKIPKSDYPKKLKEQWFKHRNSKVISIANFNKMITSNNKIISKSLSLNSKIWPYDAHWYKDDNNYIEEIKLMQDFVIIRINKLDNYFSNL